MASLADVACLWLRPLRCCLVVRATPGAAARLSTARESCHGVFCKQGCSTLNAAAKQSLHGRFWETAVTL